MDHLPVCSDLVHAECVQPVHPRARTRPPVRDRRHFPYVRHHHAEHPLPEGVPLEHPRLCVLHHLLGRTFHCLPVHYRRFVEVRQAQASGHTPVARNAGVLAAARAGCDSRVYYRLLGSGVPRFHAGYRSQRHLLDRLPCTDTDRACCVHLC